MKSFFARLLPMPGFSLIRRKNNNEKDHATKSPSALEHLPAELKQQVISFLSVRDLLNLRDTSKCMGRDLGISVKSLYLPGPVSQSGSFQATRSTQCFAALIPKQASQSYATTLSCNAFTNNHFSHGTIWIVEQNLSKNDDPEALTSRHFRCGKAVANASTAESRELVLSFFPKVGKFYQFWIHIARSQLRVHSIELHLVGLGMEPMKPMKPSDHARLQSEVRRLLPRSTDIFAISGVGHYCSAQAAPKICVALLERPSTS